MAHDTCPVWIGYLLASPIRRLVQKPEVILSPYVKSAMTVLDIGPGMGFFSLPMARMVGPGGRVICVDLQAGMLDRLRKRAAKVGLADRVETRLCRADSLGVDDLTGKIDFALAFAMVHEMSNPEGLFVQLQRALKPGGSCLVAEPTGHVSQEDFRKTIAMAQVQGLVVVDRPQIWHSLSILLTRQ
jgi:ubiquinone/menaquinone biosynthesis C-methylase UbiE